MSNTGKNPYTDKLRRKVIEPLQAFRQKVSPPKHQPTDQPIRRQAPTRISSRP